MKAFGPALALFAAAVSAPAPALEPIRVPALGFSIERPESWQPVSEDERIANLRRVDPIDRVAVERALEETAERPIISIIKYPLTHRGVNPTIQVSAMPRSRLARFTPLQLMENTIGAFRTAFADAEIEEGPVVTHRFGAEGAYARIAFMLRTGGETLPTRSEMWLVPSGDWIFVISAGTGAGEPASTRAEIDAILGSVHLVAPPTSR